MDNRLCVCKEDVSNVDEEEFEYKDNESSLVFRGLPLVLLFVVVVVVDDGCVIFDELTNLIFVMSL